MPRHCVVEAHVCGFCQKFCEMHPCSVTLSKSAKYILLQSYQIQHAYFLFVTQLDLLITNQSMNFLLSCIGLLYVAVKENDMSQREIGRSCYQGNM